MKLYHGTDARFLPRILKQGILPRASRKSNWNKAPSHAECVYLTDAYAAYFAICAAKKEGLVLEIDTDRLMPWDFLPDEDFLAQVEHTGNPKKGVDLLGQTADFRGRLLDWVFTDVWGLSLKHLGTCAYHGVIPPSAITRYATFDLKENSNLIYVFDPVICLANYAYCGPRYRRCNAHLFGDPILPKQEGEILFPGDEERCAFEKKSVRVVKLEKVAA